MKIGIFGGSFDPIHNGHIRLAQYALAHTDLEQLWLMVSPRNPLKEHGPIATDQQRLEMARLAVDGIPGIEVSDFEFHLSIPSYTYNTLTELQKTYPEHKFRLLIGGDNWTNFYKWRNPDEIISQFGLIIYPRPDESLSPINNNLKLTTDNLKLTTDSLQLLTGAPQMSISSTQIRFLLTTDTPESSEILSKVLMPSVRDYIDRNGIYHGI